MEPTDTSIQCRSSHTLISTSAYALADISVATLSSDPVQEIQDKLPVGRRQRTEPFARRRALATVRIDRIRDRRCPAVVQEMLSIRQPPQRGGPELAAGGRALFEPIGERPHV